MDYVVLATVSLAVAFLVTLMFLSLSLLFYGSGSGEAGDGDLLLVEDSKEPLLKVTNG